MWKYYWIQDYKYGNINRKRELDLIIKRPIVRSKMIGTTMYASYQIGDDIKAMVILTKVKYSKIGVKIIDEEEGPLYYECPLEILNTLTPTDNHVALEWRDKCKRHVTSTRMFLNKLKVGSIISFKAPYDLKGGAKKGDKIFLEKKKPGRKLRWVHDGYFWDIEIIPEDYVIEVDASKKQKEEELVEN